MILGAIVGAGFATGQEIYIFFARYKICGVIGAVLSSFIISYILYIVFNYMRKNNIKNYTEYLEKIFKNNKVFCYLNKNIIDIFLLLSFYIMELGFISLLWQQYCFPKSMGMILVTILGYIILRGNAKMVIKINVILIPIIIITLLYVVFSGLSTFGSENVDIYTDFNSDFGISAIIYSSYNFIMLFPLIAGLKDRNISKTESKIICIVVFFIITVFSVSMILLLSMFDLVNIEVPIIFIANFIESKIVVISTILILLAIFTSIICVGYTFLNNISVNDKVYKRNLLSMCLVGLPLVNLSFASTMRVVYTFLGIVGIIQILGIILANFRKN